MQKPLKQQRNTIHNTGLTDDELVRGRKWRQWRHQNASKIRSWVKHTQKIRSHLDQEKKKDKKKRGGKAKDERENKRVVFKYL